ncbi:MAG: osmotically inducible protein, partial [Phenylobacterium sp.]|nr:osmotically inducible protein [Phenylobacterium sp.]
MAMQLTGVIAPDARYRMQLDAGGHRLVADEPAANGGADAGPSPFLMVLAGLAACTGITLRMYAERHGWTDVG